jgi:hypothetical protein
MCVVMDTASNTTVLTRSLCVNAFEGESGVDHDSCCVRRIILRRFPKFGTAYRPPVGLAFVDCVPVCNALTLRESMQAGRPGSRHRNAAIFEKQAIAIR